MACSAAKGDLRRGCGTEPDAMDLKRVDDIYRERTSLTAAQIEEFRRHAVYFDAVAARDAGIVHEIASLSIPPRANITALNPSTTPTP
jgi:hypothetical protein